jgi:hypothetical protein
MFCIILLVIAAYTTTKAVRDAVFLSKFGLTELSYMMIGIAVAAGFVVSTYKRLTAGVGRNVVSIATNSFVALTLVAMAIGLKHQVPFLSWALYFWSGVFGLVLVAEFWLLANDLFNAREAKRLFPIIGSGAILGGFLGGALSSWLARPLGSYNLLYLVAVELLVASLLSHLAWKLRRPEVHRELSEAPVPRFSEGLATLRGNRYARLIALMLVCMTVCMTIVQWQYKGIAKLHFGSRRDDMTAFFGGLAAALNLASFALQLLGTPRLLKRWGVGVGLRVLPAGFTAGALTLMATAVLSIPMLGAAAAAVLLSDGLRFSVDKASTELLYLPIARAVKDQAKPFIDTFVDRASGALAGFLWLFLTWAFHVDRGDRIVFASCATLLVTVAWLAIIARARRAYVDAYRGMLGISPTPAAATASAPVSEDPKQVHRRARAERVLQRLDGDARRRYKDLRGLARLVRSAPLGLSPETIAPHLAREIELVRTLVRACRDAVLERRLAETVENVFALLVLAYPHADVRAAERALAGDSPAVRAGALELLDNLVVGELKPALLEVLDGVAFARRWPPPSPPPSIRRDLVPC